MARGDDAARRILVIDNDRDVAEAAAITLESWGCTVAMASDADQALATLDGFDAGVALIDVRLDGADGLALIAILQAKTPGLLCIVSSAYADIDMTIGALRAGAEDFLRKPLDEAELYAALERCFAKRALRRDKVDAEAAVKQARDELESRVETRTAELLETNSQLLQENADRARVEDELRDSEAHYRSLFDESPLGVWEEDWSAIKVMLDGLARRGVKDWRGYFQRRPEQLRKAYDLGVATEVNQAVCTIYGAPDKQAVIDMTVSDLVLAGELEGFRDILLSFVGGGFDVAYEAEDKRYDGSFIFIRSHIVVPALNQLDWARVIFTVEDINARREVERALEESRAQFQSILDNSPAMISLKDSEGRYLLANRVFEQIFGTTGERIEGKFSKDVLPAENVESARAQDLHILRNLKPHSVEETIHVGGEDRTVLTTKFPVLDDSGEALAIGSIASDITERKLVEDALRESEAFLRSVVDSAPAAINIRDKDDRFILVNKLLADYYGTTPENMIGRFSDKFGRPERGATDDPEDISEVLATGETTLMHEATYSDGTTWLTSRAPVKGDDGTVAYVVTTAFDISDRKRAEEAVRRSEARLAETQQLARVGSWRLDVATGDVEWSDQSYILFGFEPQSVAVSFDMFKERIHPDDHALVEQRDEALRNTSTPHVIEFRVVLPDGGERIVEERGEVVRDEGGDATAFVGSLQDVTERRQAENALRNSEQSLANAQQLAHIGNWDHDLATGILRWSDELYRMIGLERGDIDVSFKSYLKLIHTHDRAMVEELDARLHRAYEPYSVDYRLIRPDGTLRHVHSEASIAFDDAGAPVRMSGIDQDITERKRAEEALKESEVRYREVFEDAPSALWVEDWSRVKQMVDRLTEEGVEDFAAYFADHRDLVAEVYDLVEVLQVSEANLEIYGATSIQQLVDAHTAAIVSPEELDALVEILLRLIEGRWSLEKEAPYAKMDGTEIVFRTRSVVPPAHRHDWSRMIYSLEDVTERKRAEEALKESEVRYREIFDDAPTALWVEDWSRIKQMIDRLTEEGVEDFAAYFADHRDLAAEAYDLAEVLQVSEASLELYGATSIQQLVNADTAAIVSPEELDALVEILLELIEGRWSLETESLDAKMDGTEIMFRTRSVVPPAHRHDWSRLIYSFEDITERKRAEEALKESEVRYREVFDDAPTALWVEDWSRIKQMVDRLTEEGVEDFAAYFADHPELVAEAYDSTDTLQISDACRELYGATSIQQLIDSHSGALVLPEELDAFTEMLLGLTEGRWHQETGSLDAKMDGTEIMFRTRFVVPPAHRHDWSRLIYSLEDIDDRKRAEEALKESEVRYREVFDDAPSALWVQDWSRIKQMIDRLTDEGVEDFAAYFADHRDFVAETYDLIDVLQISEANLELFGATSIEQLVDASRGMHVLPEEVDAFAEILLGLTEGRWSQETESLDDKMDGTEIMIRTRSVVPPAHRHDWSRLIYSLEDVTERKRAEEALKESEARYREVFDDAPSALWVEDWSRVKQMVDRLTEEGVEDFGAYFADHRDLVAEAYDLAEVLQVSEANLELYGATSIQQLVDSHNSAIVSPEELDAHVEILLRLIEGRWSLEKELPYAKFDGTKIMFRTRSVVPPAHRHDWSRLIYSLEDVTERKQAEEALKESEVRYREVFDDAPSALWVEDWSRAKQMVDRLAEEGVEDFGAYLADHPELVTEAYDVTKTLQISDANLELYGATSTQRLIDGNYGALVLPEELGAFAEILLGLIEGRWSLETESLDDKMDGTEIMIRTRAVVPPAHRHDWSRLIYSLEDITERKRSEEALKESEVRYREVFDDAPGALWVEDWSRIKQMVDRLTEEGVEDFGAYFADHRELVVEAYDLVEILQISDANLELFGATSTQQVVDRQRGALVLPEELGAFVEVLLGHIEGRWSQETESLDAKMDGTEIMIRTRAVVPPAHRHDWSRLIYSLEDITERRRAEEALRDSEERLKQAQDIAHIGNYLWDEVNNEIIQRSEVIYEIYGVSSEDAPNSFADTLDLVHPDDRERVRVAPQMAFVDGASYDLEYRIVRPDGEIRHVHEISDPEFDDAGTVVRSAGIIQDITEIKAAEERFRTLIESSPDAMIVINQAGEIVLINDQAQILFGYDRGELVGMTVESLMPQAYRQQHSSFRKTYVADPSVRPMGQAAELHAVNRDGLEFPVEISLSPIRNEEGMLVAATVRDITERRRAEEAIRTRDAWLGGILEHAPIQVVLKDTDGRIMAISQNVADFFGLTRDDFIGRTTVDFLPEEIANTYMAADREVIEKGELVQQEVTEERDGAILHYLNAKFPLRDSAGKTIGVCSLTSDVTEVKTVQEQLYQAQKMEAVGQLTGGIAHDFNNLLAVVMGNLELVEDEMEGNDELRELLSLAIGATDDAAVLTQRLLAFSRKQPLSPREADANDLVDKIVALMRRTLDESIDLRTALTGNLAPIFVDSSQLENALVNLLVNARDAMPRGGRVTIETGVVYLDKTSAAFEAEMAPGDYVTVAVSDNGEGMAPETIEHAVEPFFTTKKIGEGSGLGLSMVFGFVKQSGGHITIESELGRGTTVTLFLPVAIEMAVDDAPPSDGVEDRRGAGEAILVVEDNEPLRQLAVLNLISLGYSVHQAGDGMAALEVLDQTPDIVLLFTDIVLPGAMDGVQLALEARARRSDLRVLYTSAYPQNALVEQGRIDGEFDLVEKPYRKSDLAVRMAAALASPGTIEMPKESA
jgi:PAS domain S-box-containing protein